MSLFTAGATESPSELLLNAASFNRKEAMIAAIRDGGDVNFVRMDIAPTLICAMREYEECLEALMVSGARADIPNRLGWTALHEAAIKESPACLDFILSYPEQTNMKAKDKEGTSVLVACMRAGRMQNAKKILSAFPETGSVKDNVGNSALSQAVLDKKLDWVEFFLKQGLSPYDSNEKRDNASTLVIGWEDGERALKDAGFKLGQKEEVKEPLNKESQNAPAVDAEPAVEEPSNPFGLGRVKKKTFSN